MMLNRCVIKQWNDLLRQWNGGKIMPNRNDRPAALFDIYWRYKGKMNLDLLAWATADSWVLAEFPLQMMEVECWLDFFYDTGFNENGVRKPLPNKVPTLYRGCAANREIGMSWTDDRDKAIWFYQRNKDWGFESVLLRLKPEPVDLLAHFHGENFRDESEWVVEPMATTKATSIREE